MKEEKYLFCAPNDIGCIVAEIPCGVPKPRAEARRSMCSEERIVYCRLETDLVGVQGENSDIGIGAIQFGYRSESGGCRISCISFEPPIRISCLNLSSRAFGSLDGVGRHVVNSLIAEEPCAIHRRIYGVTKEVHCVGASVLWLIIL